MRVHTCIHSYRKKERERESSICCLTSLNAYKSGPRLDLYEARNLEPIQVSSVGGLEYISHYFLLLGLYIRRKLGWKGKWDLNPATLA